jgi:CBS domain-containing protein
LRNHLNRELQRGQGLLKLMAQDDAEGRPPLGLFNRLLTTRHEGRDTIDIKRNGLRTITDAARIYALGRGVMQINTHERLQALGRLGIFDRDFIDSLRLAFEELQDLLLTHQLWMTERGQVPDPRIRIERLSSHDRERLRVSLRTARRMQDRLQQQFGVGGVL